MPWSVVVNSRFIVVDWKSKLCTTKNIIVDLSSKILILMISHMQLLDIV